MKKSLAVLVALIISAWTQQSAAKAVAVAPDGAKPSKSEANLNMMKKVFSKKNVMIVLTAFLMLSTWQTPASAQGKLEQLGCAIVYTDPKGLSISLNRGGEIVTDVTVVLPSDGKEYVCCVLMSNYQWKARTLKDLQTLSDQLCYGEQVLTGNGRQQTLTINVPFEYDKMPADGDRLYVQAYLVDMDKASVAGIGKMVLVDENKIRNSLPTAEEFEDAVVGDMMDNLFDNLFGGGGNDSSDDSDGQVCPDCGGSGVCKVCGGDKKDVNGKSCFHCTGNGKCYRCGGKGKIVGFMGF